MAYAEGQTDLSLRLYDGSIHQYRPAEPNRFQLTYFSVNDIRVKNVYDQLQRNTSESIRGDREMSTCEMLDVIRDARQEQDEARRSRAELVVQDLRTLLALPPVPVQPPATADSAHLGYCGWLKSLQGLVFPKTVQAQGNAHGQASQGSAVPNPVPPGRAAPTAAEPMSKLPQLRRPTGSRPRLSTWSDVVTATDRVREADRRADRYAVEVHKKWAISLACISFVIVGIVMALRFPRAGIGLVIGGGLAVFSIHYVGLTAGESLADRGHVAPWAAMWTPNIALTILGILGLIRVSRESGTTRGGDFQEVLDSIRQLVRRARGMVSG
jgi:lipopolysaccharide export system permease protein